MQYRFAPIDDTTRFILPIWCYRGPQGIYHDYLVQYYNDAALNGLLDRSAHGFSFADAAEAGVSRDAALAWYRDGYLVPQPPESN